MTFWRHIPSSILVAWIVLFMVFQFDVSQHHHVNHHEEESCAIHALGVHQSVSEDLPYQMGKMHWIAFADWKWPEVSIQIVSPKYRQSQARGPPFCA